MMMCPHFSSPIISAHCSMGKPALIAAFICLNLWEIINFIPQFQPSQPPRIWQAAGEVR